jgi:hypothetical protein
VELPRYQSRSVTTPASISPAQAGAGAAAMSEAFAKGFDVTSQVTGMIAKAEAEMAAQASLAELRAELTTFTADPRWQQSEIEEALPAGQAGPVRGTRPTAEVLAEEWKKKQRNILAKTPAIGWRETKAQFEAQRRQLLATAGAEIIGQQRKLQIDRAKGLGDFAAEQAVRAGDWAGAKAIHQRNLQNGALTVAEFGTRLQKVVDQEVETGILQMLDPNSGVPMDVAVDAIYNDPRIAPGRRTTLLLSAVREAERRDRSEAKGLKASQDANASNLLAIMQDTDPDTMMRLIMETPLTEVSRQALIKATQTRALEGPETPEGNRLVSGITGSVIKGTPRDDALSELKDLADAGRISQQQYTAAMKEVISLSNMATQDPVRDNYIRIGKNRLMKGMEYDAAISVLKAEEVEQRLIQASNFETDFYAASMEALRNGQKFDSKTWFDQNIQTYMDAAKGTAPEGKWNYLIVEKDGVMDVEGTRQNIVQRTRAEPGKRPDLTTEQATQALKSLGIKSE